jgi:hypothetical protein
MTWETVDFETLALRATSLMLGRLVFFVRDIIVRPISEKRLRNRFSENISPKRSTVKTLYCAEGQLHIETYEPY